MKKDTIQIDQDEFRLNVDIYVFREGENYISYCPSLDICSSGKNFNDAVKNFYEAFELYADYWTEHGTLEADLKAHKNNLAALGVSRKEFLEFFD
jgi:predicted RNase H-like HicB family nuclease